MSHTEPYRAWVLSRLSSCELTVAEAAELLGLTEHSIRRLRVRLAGEGPAALVHGNRGRVSPRRLDDETRTRILELAQDENLTRAQAFFRDWASGDSWLVEMESVVVEAQEDGDGYEYWQAEVEIRPFPMILLALASPPDR